jgi:hypothetical protein
MVLHVIIVGGGFEDSLRLVLYAGAAAKLGIPSSTRKQDQITEDQQASLQTGLGLK